MALQKMLEYRLRWNDFDRFSRIKPDTVLDIFQDLATLQAEEMGIGRNDMLAQQVFWVIVRVKYEVIAQPGRDIVQVRTWPHTPTRFSFLRDFEMKDLDGKLLIKGTSEWVLVNAETRKFEQVSKHYHGSNDFVEDRMFESKPKKIAPLKDLSTPLCRCAPRYSDIDVNDHVNNARYPQLIMDALQLDADHPIHTFQIDYRYEVTTNDNLSFYAQEVDNTIVACGVLEDGTIAFNCKIEVG